VAEIPNEIHPDVGADIVIVIFPKSGVHSHTRLNPPALLVYDPVTPETPVLFSRSCRSTVFSSSIPLAEAGIAALNSSMENLAFDDVIDAEAGDRSKSSSSSCGSRGRGFRGFWGFWGGGRTTWAPPETIFCGRRENFLGV